MIYDKLVEFAKRMTYKGRNGWGTMTGLSLEAMQNGNGPFLWLAPVTSHGDRTDACYMQVPFEALPDLRSAIDRVILEGLADYCKERCRDCRRDADDPRDRTCMRYGLPIGALSERELRGCGGR